MKILTGLLLATTLLTFSNAYSDNTSNRNSMPNFPIDNTNNSNSMPNVQIDNTNNSSNMPNIQTDNINNTNAINNTIQNSDENNMGDSLTAPVIIPSVSEIAPFTCTDFAKNAATCTPYSCATPSNIDPTKFIQWTILNTHNKRCVISNTSTDVGLEDEKGNAKPVTKTCEYDSEGIDALNNFMDNLKSNNFNPMENANLPGSYNCEISSQGNPITHTPYVILPDDNE